MRKAVNKKTFASLWVLILTACASVPQEQTPAESTMENVVQDSRAKPVEVPDEISDALLSGSAVGSRGGTLSPLEERFDVSVNQVPARTFFISLVADSGINVVAHPDISGSISLELKNVTVPDVLEVTRDVYGYEYKLSNNIYSIYPRKMRTEVFPINYIDVERKGFTETSVRIGEIVSNNDNSGNGNSSNRSSSGRSGDAEERMASGSRIETTNVTNFWQHLDKTISAIIGGNADGRMVMVNPQAGLVVVNAMPREISAVRNFLERSELSIKRQVILETKIVEVRLFEDFEAGINWNQIQGQLLLTNNVTSFNSPVDITGANESLGEIFSSIFKVGDISSILSLLQTQGNVQVLSSPRVSTVNNQKAIIRVGSDEFFVTGISNQTTQSAAAVTSTPNIELTSFFSGISLDVTPQIAENGDVILHVHPIVSEVVDQQKDITVGDQEFSLPLALRDIRESDSIVRAQSGQVVVLGGLMQETLTDIFGKRPVLGDIPVLNGLFRTKSKGKQKTELVILMRPIVVEEDSWRDQLSNGANRIRELSDEYRAR